MMTCAAAAFDETKYPDWSGQWWRPKGVGFQWDQTKPPGLGQEAPLTQEYQAGLEASLGDQAAGGQGGDNSRHVIVGKEDYFVGGDGYLMPSRKGQASPDLRYFETRK